ncbi:MAG: hypothetical protein ABIG20_01950 [archaeon]
MRLGLKTTILLLILVNLFSGCISSGDTGNLEPNPEMGRTYGLIITGFSSRASVDELDTVDIDLYVQNIGDADARSIEAQLFQKEGFSVVENIKKYSRLFAPDEALGMEGEIFSPFWVATAPGVAQDEIKSLKARVTYTYNSTATTNVYLVSKEDMDEKGESSFATYSTSSQAPITVSIVSLPALKVRSGNVNVPIDMSIRNTGTGVVVDDQITGFSMSVNGDKLEKDTLANCSGLNSDKESITLFGNAGERAVKCDIPLTFTGQSQSYIIEVTIKYRYYIDTAPLAILVENDPLQSEGDYADYEDERERKKSTITFKNGKEEYDFDKGVLGAWYNVDGGDVSAREFGYSTFTISSENEAGISASDNCNAVSEYNMLKFYTARENDIYCIITDKGALIQLEVLNVSSDEANVYWEKVGTRYAGPTYVCCENDAGNSALIKNGGNEGCQLEDAEDDTYDQQAQQFKFCRDNMDEGVCASNTIDNGECCKSFCESKGKYIFGDSGDVDIYCTCSE